MVTLGEVLGAVITSNPSIVVLPTRKLEVGKAVEVEGLKKAVVNGKSVLVLTI